MADGLSIVASIAGLISIADIIVRRGYKYVKAVKEADKSIKALIEEVNSLSGILHSLRNVAETLQDDQVAFEPTTQIHYVEECYQTLQKVQKLLEEVGPIAGEGRFDSTKRKLKWPISGSHINELLSEIGKQKTTMTLAMNVDEMSALVLLLARQSSLQDSVSVVERGLESDRAKRHQIQLNEKTKQVFQFLGNIDAQKWQGTNIRLRQPGTGIWFTDGLCFKSWLAEEKSKLWVYGIPGAGKTVLMSSAIQEVQRRLDSSSALAFFYCDYKDTATHQPQNILGALVKQFATEDERCFECLEALYQKNKLKNQSTKAPNVEELCALLLQMTKFFNNAIIIVDGLDEISQNRSDVATILAGLNTPGGTIKTLFSSRREYDLEYPLREYTSMSIAAMSSDLRLYVGSEVVKREESKKLRIQDPSLKETIVETLINGADGMFRWVACQMDYLCECNNDRDRREALKKLPPDLPSSYERILERINKSSQANQTLVIRALNFLVYCRTPLTTKALLQGIAVEPGQNDFDPHAVSTEEDLFHWCSSLIRRKSSSASPSIELAHFTVKEYLLSLDSGERPSLAKYHLNEDDGMFLLAITSLTFLNYKTFQQVILPQSRRKLLRVQMSLVQEFEFLAVASDQWEFYASRHAKDPTINALIRKLLCPTLCSQFKLWRSLKRYELCLPGEEPPGGEPYAEVSDVTPLHWAAMFGFETIVDEILQCGVDPNQDSDIGTPLGCAILGFQAFRGFEIDDVGILIEHSLDHSARVNIVGSLLAAGANLEVAQAVFERLPLSLAILVESFYEPRMCLVLLKGNAKLHAPDIADLRKRDDIFGTDEGISREEFAHAVYEAALAETDNEPMQEEIFRLAMDAPMEVAKPRRLRALSFHGTMSTNTHDHLVEWLQMAIESLQYDEGLEDYESFELGLKALRTSSLSLETALEDLRKLILYAVEVEADEDILRALLEDNAVFFCTDDAGNTLLHSILSKIDHGYPTEASSSDDDDGGGLSNSVTSMDSIQEPSEESFGDSQSRSSQDIDVFQRSVKILLEHGANVATQNKKGETALHLAIRISDMELFRLIYDAAPRTDILKTRSRDGRTLLEYATEVGCMTIVDFLTDEYDKISEDFDPDPILEAARLKKWDTVKNLMESGLSTASVLDRSSHVIHYAAKAGEETIVEMLLEKSPNEIIELRDEEGATPLLLSTRASENVSTFQLLLNYGADSKAISDIGSIAENAICAVGNDIRNLLLPLKIDWNYRTKCIDLLGGSIEGCPIHKAAYEGRLEVVEFLLKHNLTNPDMDIGNGFTPLNLATRGKHLEVVTLLLKHGAAINSVDRFQQTPFFLAVKARPSEIVGAMLELGRDKEIIDAILRLPDGRKTMVRWFLKNRSPPRP